MASMWSVAKFLTISSRGRTGSKRVDSSDSVTLAGGDRDIVKIPSPLPAPVASEVVAIPDKLEPQQTEAKRSEASPPELASRTQSEIVSLMPTEGVETPQEEQSTWTGDEKNTVVHEPEETRSLETKVEPKGLSERQSSASSSLHKVKIDQGTESSKKTGEQKDDSPEKLPETDAVIDVESLSDKKILPMDLSTDPEPQERHADSQDSSREEEIDLKKDVSEKAVFVDDNHRLQEELRNALYTIDEKTKAVNHLLNEVGRLKGEIRAVTLGKEEALLKAEKERVRMEERTKTEMEKTRRVCKEVEEAARRETRRVKGLIAVERYSHNERVKEFEKEREELNAMLEAARKESQRVKGMIGVQRHSHNEQVKEFRQEKEELITSLEVARSEVLASVIQIESQREQISGLEARLEECHEGMRDLHDKHYEQVNTVKRIQEEIVEERDKVSTRDIEIRSLRMTNHSLSTFLVELQFKTNKAERHNRMLLEQICQQSDQLQNRQYTDIFGTGFGRLVATNTFTAFSSLTRGIRRGADQARADLGMKTVKQLNDQIFQLAASLTDQLEGFDKRFVSDDSLSYFSRSEHHEPIGVRRAKAEYLKSALGLELVNRLETDAPRPMKNVNPFYVQVALQGCLTACCMRIITSWYPNEWEYGKFLEVLYNRIRGTGGLEMALNWRKTTQQNCTPTIPRDRNSKLVDYLKDDLRAVLNVSGWSRESDADALLESLRDKLFNLVSLALRLNTMAATGVPGELEPVWIERGSLFDWRQMADDCAPDRSKKTELIPKEETVLCAVALGLRWTDGSDVDMPRLLLKPRVVLESAIVV